MAHRVPDSMRYFCGWLGGNRGAAPILIVVAYCTEASGNRLVQHHSVLFFGVNEPRLFFVGAKISLLCVYPVSSNAADCLRLREDMIMHLLLFILLRVAACLSLADRG